jgi:hypothetical protein
LSIGIEITALQEILKAMHQFNKKPENWDIKDYAPGTSCKDDTKEKQWGLSQSHHLLTLAYNLAFTCLLCFNEVLKIQAHDITLYPGATYMEVRLPFRKTSQFEGA